jgi:hypothetical protein
LKAIWRIDTRRPATSRVSCLDSHKVSRDLIEHRSELSLVRGEPRVVGFEDPSELR